MRSSRDSVFVAVLILAIIASTSVAIIAATGAGARTTVQIQGGGGFTDSTSATAAAGGSGNGSSTTRGGTSGGSSGGSGGGGAGGGNQTAGITGNTITVGGIFTESGGLDAHVEEDTVRACFNMANAQGGVSGHKLQLVSYDDQLNGDTAYAEAVKLDQQNHIFAVVGWLAPFGEARAAPYFEQQGIPIIGGLGVPEEFNSPVSFPVSPIFRVDGYALGTYATNPSGPLKFKHPGVILVQTAGINDVANGIIQGAQSHGVTIKSSDVITVPFAEPNFEPYVLQFRNEHVDGIITQLDPFSYVRLYDAMESTGGVFPHLAGAGIDKQTVDSTLGSALVGTYSFMPYLEAQNNPGGNAEVALYNATVGQYYPDQVTNQDAFSEGSWVACRLFVQALKSLGPNITRAGLVSALSSGTYNIGGMAPPLNYGATGSSHAASNCASYIVYASSRRWSIASNFICY